MRPTRIREMILKNTPCNTAFAVGLITLAALAVTPSHADPITIHLVGEVFTVSPIPNVLDDNGITVQTGDPIIAEYTYDSDTPNTGPNANSGQYWHTTAPYGLRATVGGLTIQSDPSNINFLVEIADDFFSKDTYLVRSFNNTTNVPLPIEESYVFWQLDDDTMTNLDSIDLPLTPPNPADWSQSFGFELFVDYFTGGGVLIRGKINQATPEPTSIVLLGLGGLGLLRRR